MNNAEQHAAAHHEAAHAVIAKVLGATLGDVSITCEDGTWVGTTQVSWCEEGGPARKQKIFQIAVAGPFGQAKYRACLNWKGVRFDRNDWLRSVVAIIREGELAEDATLSLGFVAHDGLKHILEIRDLNDLGDLEMLQSLVQEFDHDTLLELLDMVQGRLDSQAVWAAVGDMAESLSRQQHVSADEAVATIQKHGLV